MVRDVAQSSLARLLDLQAEDTAIRLLQNRKETLPEARRLTEVREQLAELDADIEMATKQCGDVERDQARVEGEIGLVDQKIEREEKRLFSGSVSNPKELSSLQAEVAMLRTKRSVQEDELLEVMVRRDQLEETLDKLRSERESVGKEAAELTATVEVQVGDIDGELGEHSSRREAILPDIPEDLLSLYDQLRASKHGTGAAALVGGACQGCHTQLPAREVERMRAEGGLQRCDNCRRILVAS